MKTLPILMLAFACFVGGLPAAQMTGLWPFDNASNPGQARVGNPLTINGTAPVHSASLADDNGATLDGVITTVAGATNSILAQHGILANGGGTRVNQWSVAMDIFSPPGSRDSDRYLFQTDLSNMSVGDYYIRRLNDSMGTPLLNFTFSSLPEGEWKRVVLTFELGEAVRAYVDGELFYNHEARDVDDPRYSLDPSGLLLFATDDGKNAPLNVGAVAMWDGVLTSAEVANLGKAQGAALDRPPSWEAWGSGLPDPARNTLYGVSVVPGTGGSEVWAVGGRGMILQRDGGTWSSVKSPVIQTLRCVAMVDSNFGVAAGYDGALVTWNGSKWSGCYAVNGDYYRTVSIAPNGGSGVVWAAADKYGIGSFSYWDGTEWKSESGMQFFGTVSGMSMLSETDGWAVGEVLRELPGGGYGYIGQILHWDGSEWDNIDNAPSAVLNSVDMVSPVDGWAVGDDGALVRWDGSNWTEYTPSPTTEELRAVDMRTTSDGWAVGSGGTILRWDGSNWTATASPAYWHEFYGVVAVEADEAWAVGGGGLLLRWNGSVWQKVIGPDTKGLDTIAISPGSGGRDGWAVGGGGTGGGGTILHWDGSDWQSVAGSDSFYYSVDMTSSTDGWLAGSRGKMYRYDGTTWNEAGECESVRAMALISPTLGWTVGRGKIQRWDGVTWTEVASPTTQTFYGMDAVSADAVWAVAYGGNIAHYDGTSWALDPSPVSDWLIDVSMASATDGWIVGTRGIFLHWDGSAWTEVDAGVTDSAVYGVSVVEDGLDTTGWAVGGHGQVFRLQNGKWTVGSSPTDNLLWDVKMVSPKEAWAVGDYGVILHWVAPSVSPAISIHKMEGGQMQIDWTSGTLESSSTLSGDWLPLPGSPTAPYIFTPQEGARFYRARD